MYTKSQTDRIAPLLGLIRDHRFAQAIEQSGAACPDCDAGEIEAMLHCSRLAQWYVAGVEGRVEEGLDDAIKAVSRLSDAGWRHHLGFAYGSIGFVFGLQGDFENGLEWLEVAIQEAKRSNDPIELASTLSQKGGVMGFTEEWESAVECFQKALNLAGQTISVPRTKALNNLSYTQFVRARRPGLDSTMRQQLAQEALDLADCALEHLPEPARGRWRSWGLSNRAAALTLLGRQDEATQAFEEGLRLGLANPRAHLEMLVGYAALLIEQGQTAQAGELLQQAAKEAPAGGLVDASVDRIIELQIQLATLDGRHEEALKLSERRFQQAQNRYRARLRTVRRHGELFVELERTRRSQAQVAEQLRALDDRQAELQQQARFWRNEALRDPVSGALNRRGLAQSAQRLLLLDRPAALALIRLEHFAALMDSQGQAVVDEVVSQTALLLANSVRQGDLLARSRVDEFCLVMMPSDEAYARMIGQQIRSTIASHAWDGIAPGLRISVSIGTSATTGEVPLQGLLDQAEAALKKARQAAERPLRA
jgi:diguanylate cyclase (GGDEF)-like protein